MCLSALAATFAVRLAFEPDRRTVLAVGFLIAGGGCAGEAAVSALGLFTYVRPDVAGVPLWLFPLYLHGAPAVVAMACWAQLPGPPRPRSTSRSDPAGWVARTGRLRS